MEETTRVSPAQVEKCLSGVDYPADKETLKNYAEEQCGDEKVVHILDHLPNQEYNSPIDVTKAIGEIE